MKNEIFGYTGKILQVDLTTGTTSIESTLKYAKEWLGQRGIGQRILYNELKTWITPYEPANIVTIETGPLTGTLAPTACRFSIASKNTFSGGVGTSNGGGHFGPELKFAGYDLIVVQGKAKRPVYLWIHDDHIDIKDATAIWGGTTWEADDLIKEDLGDEEIQIVSIGPAGENLVRGGAVIANRNRACGKCGMGAIWGSKNLKAIAVRGSGPVKVAQPERFMIAVDSAWKNLENSRIIQRLSKYGTIGSFYGKNECNSIPYKNFQDTYIPKESADRINPDLFMERYKIKDMACMACPIHCSNFYYIDHGPYAGFKTEGFQLNTVADYAGKLALSDPPGIIRVHALCNELGLDLDASAGAISWAFECFQRGIITEKDTDGLRLEWGDYGVVLELIRKIAYREDFGNVLAEGCKRAAEILGRNSEYYAIHVKGQDLYEEIRLPISWGLGACVATRAGGHTTGSPAVNLTMKMNEEVATVGRKVFGIDNIDPDTYHDQAKLVVYFERQQEIVNSLGICMFAGTWFDPSQIGIPELAELYSAATGWETTADDLILASDRILNLEKAFNVLHANLGRKDDFPPERCLREGVTSGPYAGFKLIEKEWSKMLDEYYELRGWDPKTGLQTRECLERLGLVDIAQDLEKARKLI